MINKDFFKSYGQFILIFLFFHIGYANAASSFVSKISAIPPDIQAKMNQYTWHKGCPVPISDLSYIKLSYWGFDQFPHQGELIVNAKVASEVVDIFKKLYEQHFPIARMQLMEDFKGDDKAAMALNNTSGFNCRAQTENPNVVSLHSYGLAIDVNTLINPYVKGSVILPAEGRQYTDRSQFIPGVISHDGLIYVLFKKQGWRWGGDWKELQDYQHFEKPLKN